ncbi:TPA: hypothetical protein ACH3X3_002421 [Trebouxia sp. C0006]
MKAREQASEDPGSDSEEDFSDSEDEGTDGYKKGGYHPVKIGELYNTGRYVVVRKLGWGHFSTVWLVRDTVSGREGAMKVQKSAQHYSEAAQDEIKLLSEIRDGDPDDKAHCCRLYDWFEHTGPHGRHICMIFEVLGDNLLSLIKQYDYRGIPIPVVQRLAKQILTGLHYLHTDRKIIHTDLKPENVMLTESVKERKMREQQPEITQPPPPRLQLAYGPPLTNGAAPVSSSGLTKNQKKKIKKKQKKAGTAASGDSTSQGPTPSGDSCTTSVLKTDTQDNADSATTHAEAAPATGTAEVEKPADRQVARDQEAVSLSLEERLLAAQCKIVDFGNGCWTSKHFTDDIQTRQYRCPEVLLGAKYDTAADMWSLACMVFELITGDLLFDPRSGRDYDRDEDHLALFIELLGRMPRRLSVSGTGKYAKDYFNRHGELRHIKKMRFWPLDQVLSEKYHLPVDEAQGLSSFLLPMLEYAPDKRATAADMLRHPWLQGCLPKIAALDLNRDAASDKPHRHKSSHSRSASAYAAKRSRSPSPSPPSQKERAQNGCKVAKEQSLSSEASDQTALADANGVVSPEASSLASSGILLDLLSPQASTGLDGLAASAILVSKSDAPSVVGVARNTPTKLKQAGGEADGDWHLL